MKLDASKLAQHAVTCATFEGMSGGFTQSVEALDALLAFDRDLKSIAQKTDAERLIVLLDRIAEMRQSHHSRAGQYMRMSLTELED